MDDNDLPTSPRKKLKAHHHMDTTMDDKPTSNMPSATHIQPATVDASDEMDRLDKEVQCGIIEYVSPHLPGFTGILKKRYTDFLVNEILPNGQVIHLDNLQKPSEQEQLSNAASKSSPKQEPGQAVPVKEEPRPQFESTNLNKVEEASRKRETVYMRHGADTLSLVNGKENLYVEGHARPEAVDPSGSDGNDRAKAFSQAGKEYDTVSVKESEAPPDTSAGAAGAPRPTQPGNAGTVGGWQAYAQSNTDGEGSAKSSFQVKPYYTTRRRCSQSLVSKI